LGETRGGAREEGERTERANEKASVYNERLMFHDDLQIVTGIVLSEALAKALA
jgi:hypothetical protein